MKKAHPDNGGDEETCKAINTEYEEALRKIAGGMTDEALNADEALRNIIEKIITCDGLNIEIIGSWVWVDGNTFEHKETLKANGFKWSRGRKKWHFTADEKKRHYKGEQLDFEELRVKYGSELVKTKTRKAIA